MSVIDDLNTAVANYATNDCVTTIEGFSVTSGHSQGPTGTLNVGDDFEFKVKVVNNGKLNMKNVKIRVNGVVNGVTWAKVALSGSTGVFGSTALLDPTPPINIDAGKSFTTGFFRGEANTSTPSSDPTGVFIVTAQIDGWDGALDSILNGSSGSGDPEGTLKQVISPA
jgi:limonene-1,2-epoxide hydrolase